MYFSIIQPLTPISQWLGLLVGFCHYSCNPFSKSTCLVLESAPRASQSPHGEQAQKSETLFKLAQSALKGLSHTYGIIFKIM